MNFIWYVLISTLSGVFAGMGMGGGTFLIPLITLIMNVTQNVSQCINLLVFIPMSIVALIVHIKNKLVDFRVGIPIVIIGILFSLLGSIIANNLSNDNLRVYFGVFLLLVGVFQFVQTFINSRKNNQQNINSKFKIKIFMK